MVFLTTTQIYEHFVRLARIFLAGNPQFFERFIHFLISTDSPDIHRGLLEFARDIYLWHVRLPTTSELHNDRPAEHLSECTFPEVLALVAVDRF